MGTANTQEMVTAESSLGHSPRTVMPLSTTAAGGQQQIPMKKTAKGGNVPRNFKMLAKQSFEKQTTRKHEMTDTLDSFFDNNKIYIKSA